ncbi:APO protein 4, mitochondrial [Nymphaea colorata]|nr:APO protein 4, mitochondrial [Nymphaea colorata]
MDSFRRTWGARVDWKKLRPMILKRIRARSRDYPVRSMVPVAADVLKSRLLLIEGVSSLLHFVPIKSCRFCPEVSISQSGHLIKSCQGYRRSAKDQLHQWIDGQASDILIPVETFHLHNMFQDVIRHDQRFDFERVPAIVELCTQAGVDTSGEGNGFSNDSHDKLPSDVLPGELRSIAQRTLEAWENMRMGVKRLMMVYPVKVCQYCKEVHVGPSGHKARMCGPFKYEGWRGMHFWKAASVDDLVPPKLVWHKRPQDPAVLTEAGRGFYGHAPAVVELCAQAGAAVPKKYLCMMKANGLTRT